MEVLTAVSTLLLAVATFALCAITVWIATKDRRPHLIVENAFLEIREGLYQKQVILTLTNDTLIAVTIAAAYWRGVDFEKPIYWHKVASVGNSEISRSEVFKLADVKLMAGDVAHFRLITDSVEANAAFLNSVKRQIVIRLSSGKEFVADLAPEVVGMLGGI